jgi:dUTP pyrophosphatase
MSSSVLKVVRLTELATVPSRGSALAAGYDLSSAYDIIVPAKGKEIVKTDLAIVCPPNTYGRVAPRSGLAWKKHIDVGAGVIDADYRGNVGVVLFNHSDVPLDVKKGDRIAQLVLEKIEMLEIEEITKEELDNTGRGAGGFGSTGMMAKRARVVAPTPNEIPENPESSSTDNVCIPTGLLVTISKMVKEQKITPAGEQKTLLKKSF